MKKITILLSTYNGEKYIESQLRSIKSQTIIDDIHVVIRDDGSKDNTVNIIERWKNDLSLTLITGENVGVTNSFSSLISAAPNSEYYAFADQDDIWNNNKIEKAIEYLKGYDNSKPTLYFSNAQIADENGIPAGRNVHEKNVDLELPKVMACNPALGCTMVFNKKAMQLFRDTKIKKSPMHDKTMIILCLLLGHVVYDNNPSMLYRQHDNNVMARKNGILKRLKQFYRLWIKRDGVSLNEYAAEILDKTNDVISNEDREILTIFKNYKLNIKNRLKLIMTPMANTKKRKSNLSFKIRIFFGLA